MNNNENKIFWDKYYKTTNDDINNNSSFACFVYENYIEKYNKDNVYLKICDLGSGNCRDTKFFNNKKNLCYGIDINGVLDKESENCKLIKKDINSVLENYELKMLFDIMYMRWFLHALPYDISKQIFSNALNNLKPNGLMCIEVRSINDEILKKSSKFDKKDKSYTTTHKRWLYSIEMCKELASVNNCDVLYCEEGYFSPNKNTETENPLLIRFVCRKKLLPYYEQSINYDKYKHVLPKMNFQKTDYEMMSKLNKILEKNNIKYVAVAGSSLGLTRHGGVIPWDNDIDIGFIDEEWNKIFSIKDELIKNGLNCNKVEINSDHFHIGPIDCFKLTKKNDFYVGPASTYCSLTEYENIVKQIFGYTYIYAPFDNNISLTKRFGNKYFTEGNVNDNFHFRDHSIKKFNLNNNDLSYMIK